MKKNIKTLWFYLEPYVFVSEDLKGFFFYNSDSKKGISFDKNEITNKVVMQLQNIYNMYSVMIGVKDMENEHLYNLIKSLQEEEFGDIIESNLPKPIIMPPVLSLQKSVERMNKARLPLINDSVLSYLHEVTIFVNGKCQYDCKECKNMFRQYTHCTKSNDSINFTLLNDFLYPISLTGASINITGGDPFKYPELKNLLDVFGGRGFKQTLIVHYLNIPNEFDLLHSFTGELFRLNILVNDSYQEKSLVDSAEKLLQNNINQLWEIGITSVLEYEKAELLSEQLIKRNIDVNIKPLYNGNNLIFFKENVFIQQEDIIFAELDRQEVFALQKLNTNDFGKITIMYDGRVYANINKAPIGDFKERIGEILCRELEYGESWRYTRYNLKICNKCRFKETVN